MKGTDPPFDSLKFNDDENVDFFWEEGAEVCFCGADGRIGCLPKDWNAAFSAVSKICNVAGISTLSNPEEDSINIEKLIKLSTGFREINHELDGERRDCNSWWNAMRASI